MWRSYDAFRDGESPCVNVVRCLVLVCPAIGKLRMDVGDEWYVRVNVDIVTGKQIGRAHV